MPILLRRRAVISESPTHTSPSVRASRPWDNASPYLPPPPASTSPALHNLTTTGKQSLFPRQYNSTQQLLRRSAEASATKSAVSSFLPPSPRQLSPPSRSHSSVASSTYESSTSSHTAQLAILDEGNDLDLFPPLDRAYDPLPQHTPGSSGLRTRIGHRTLKPLIAPRRPPPLVGLPIPKTALDPARDSQHHLTNRNDIDRRYTNTESDLESRDAIMASPAPVPNPRYSTRTSLRHSVRHSVRFSTTDVDLPPPPLHQAPPPPPPPPVQPHSGLPSTPGATSFDDPDSFDTFATIPDNFNINDEETPLPPIPVAQPAPVLSPSSPSSLAGEKPAFPFMASSPPTSSRGVGEVGNMRASGEEDDGALDVPGSLAASPAADRALRDLQRASVTAANELAATIRAMSQSGAAIASGQGTTPTGAGVASLAAVSPSLSAFEKSSPMAPMGNGMPPSPIRGGGNRLQGQLHLRSRIFRRWNVRYATIIQQAFFGPVLLLFRPDGKALFPGGMSLKSSKMIALTESSVRAMENESSRGPSAALALFELTTSQRTYVFGCMDENSRAMWMESLALPHLLGSS